ncbi:MAG: hypothetical protein HQ503_10705, partial [Rhodospirillales bacterium]|nr:hypothetical protein [Rhodospirillales bacterium]
GVHLERGHEPGAGGRVDMRQHDEDNMSLTGGLAGKNVQSWTRCRQPTS